MSTQKASDGVKIGEAHFGTEPVAIERYVREDSPNGGNAAYFCLVGQSHWIPASFFAEQARELEQKAAMYREAATVIAEHGTRKEKSSLIETSRGVRLTPADLAEIKMRHPEEEHDCPNCGEYTCSSAYRGSNGSCEEYNLVSHIESLEKNARKAQGLVMIALQNLSNAGMKGEEYRALQDAFRLLETLPPVGEKG